MANQPTAQKQTNSALHNATAGPHATEKNAGKFFENEQEAAKDMEGLFTAVVNGDAAAAEAPEDLHRRTVDHLPLDDDIRPRFAEFKTASPLMCMSSGAVFPVAEPSEHS